MLTKYIFKQSNIMFVSLLQYHVLLYLVENCKLTWFITYLAHEK